MFSRKRLKKYINDYGVITMFDFLSSYVGLNTQLDSLKKATHKELKFFGFDNVVTVPFQVVDNDNLASGIFIFVEDYHHNIAVYKNPLCINTKKENNSKIKKSRSKVKKF